MQVTNVWMTDTWRERNITDEFRQDIKVLGKQVAADYKKLGLEVRLYMDGCALKLVAGVNTNLGFLETNVLFFVYAGETKAKCSGQIAKHMVTIYEIFLLLEKYGYADRIGAFRHPYDDQFDIETNAQTELMNLQLI